MWQSIKKFFKRIADCTRISWIARKVSSGWNSVKNWWSGNKVSRLINTNSSENKTTEKPSISVNGSNITNEPSSAKPEPAIGSIFENQGGVLELFVEINHTGKIFGDGLVGIAGNADLNYTETLDRLKYRVYIKCGEGRIFKITCDKLIRSNGKGAFFSIESIASQDGKDSSSELEGMKNMLGLNGKHAADMTVQSLKDPIKPAVTSSASNMSANNSKVPSLEAVYNNSEPNKVLNNPSKERLTWSRIIIPKLQL